MLTNLLDRILYKDTFIGRYYIKSTSDKREQLMRFRERFNRKQREIRVEAAKKIAGDAAFEIKKDDGFLILPNSGIPEISQLVERGAAIMSKIDPNTARGNKKEQLLTRLLPKEELRLDSPFIQLVLRKDVIAAISNYLGMIPILNKVDIWYSRSQPGAEYSNSQLHHCDFESDTQLKLFVFINEVTPESGPLYVVDAKSSEMVREKIGYKFGQKIQDPVVEKYVPASEQHAAVGPKGTMVFADTSRCFHYGSRVDRDDQYRIVAMYQFLRPESFGLSLDYKKNSKYNFLATPDMPDYQRLFLGAE